MREHQREKLALTKTMCNYNKIFLFKTDFWMNKKASHAD